MIAVCSSKPSLCELLQPFLSLNAMFVYQFELQKAESHHPSDFYPGASLPPQEVFLVFSTPTELTKLYFLGKDVEGGWTLDPEST